MNHPSPALATKTRQNRDTTRPPGSAERAPRAPRPGASVINPVGSKRIVRSFFFSMV